MNISFKATAFLASFCALASTAAFAHAFLDRAIPGVGSTVSGSPAELQLSFTEGVVVALSGVKVAAAGGGSIAAAKPVGDPANSNVLHVRLARALHAGTYVVTWHVVSIDSHRTSGTYTFTVVP